MEILDRKHSTVISKRRFNNCLFQDSQLLSYFENFKQLLGLPEELTLKSTK